MSRLACTTYQLIDKANNNTYVNLTTSKLIDLMVKLQSTTKPDSVEVKEYSQRWVYNKAIPVSYKSLPLVEIDGETRTAVNINGGYYFIDCRYWLYDTTEVIEVYNSNESFTVYNDWDGEGYYILSTEEHIEYR